VGHSATPFSTGQMANLKKASVRRDQIKSRKHVTIMPAGPNSKQGPPDDEARVATGPCNRTGHVDVFWVVTPSSGAVGYQRFGGTCCLHLQIEMNTSEDGGRKVLYILSHHLSVIQFMVTWKLE
jgi:hypothetical protein